MSDDRKPKRWMSSAAKEAPEAAPIVEEKKDEGAPVEEKAEYQRKRAPFYKHPTS